MVKLNNDLPTVLLAYPNPEIATQLQKELMVDYLFNLIHVTKLSEVIRELNSKKIDCIALDMNLEDSQGMDTIKRIKRLKHDDTLLILIKRHEEINQAIQNEVDECVDIEKLTLETLTRQLSHPSKKPSSDSRQPRGPLKFDAVTDGLACGLFLLNKRQVMYCNKTLLTMLSTQNEKFISQGFTSYIHEDHIDYYQKWIHGLWAGKQSKLQIEIVITPKQNEALNVELIAGFMTLNGEALLQIIVNDITKKKEYETDLQHLTQSNALSQTINTNLFKEHLHHAIKNTGAKNNRIVVLYLELNQHALITDTYGYKLAAIFAQTILEKLKKVVGNKNQIFQLSSHLYGIVTSQPKTIQAVNALITQITKACSEPYVIEKKELHTTVSMGASLYPDHGVTSDSLMKNAELALYHAKTTGRNSYLFYTDTMGKHIEEKKELLKDLSDALENNEFLLYYQPILDTRMKTVLSLEALLRWKRKEDTILSPSHFLNELEEIGMIDDVTDWVIEEVARQHLAWQKKGIPPLRIAINLSTQQFTGNNRIVDSLKKTLKKTKLPESCFSFEVNENITVLGVAQKTLEQLHDMHIILSIDNFGESAFSLSQFKYNHISEIKIDHSIIQTLNEIESHHIIEAIIAMAEKLGLTVIAEGVETKEHVTFLEAAHCYLMQGHYFAMTMSADETAAYLLKGKV